MDDFDERLRAFAHNIQQDVFARADSSEDGALRADAFAELMFGYLRDAGAIDDGKPRDIRSTQHAL